MKIHPTAIVHPDAQLAEDVEVQPYSIIGPKVRIGAGTVVGPHCVIEGDTDIGERNRFSASAQIGILTQDLKHNPDLPGKCRIGNDNVIREFVTITGSTMQTEDQDDRVTSLGDSNFLMCYVHVGHDCHIRNHCIIASYTGVSGHIEVHDHANIAGLTALHQDIHVGSYCFIGGMSPMSKDAVPYMVTGGIPPGCHGPNTVGLQRHGFDKEARRRIKELYKIMFRSNLNTQQALAEIERSVDASEERRYFIEFVQESVRGITK